MLCCRAALTASRDTRFQLFAVDGKTNEKIYSSKFEQFTPSAAHFICGGKQVSNFIVKNIQPGKYSLTIKYINILIKKLWKSVCLNIA